MSINHFGAEFFQSLDPPKDARLSASFASLDPSKAPASIIASPKTVATRKKGLSRQAGTKNNNANDSCFDEAKPNAADFDKLEHSRVWAAFTEGNDRYLSADQRMDALAFTEIGAVLGVIRLLREDGTMTDPFITILGLPTVAMQGSKAAPTKEDFGSSDGALEPCGVIYPEDDRPILTTTIIDTRGVTSPGELKLKMWKFADSSLVLLKGKEAVEPILIPDVIEHEPKAGDMEEGMFIQDKDVMEEKMDPSICPTQVEAAASGDEIAGFWYGARMIPFAPVHNLPLGFAMDPTKATSGRAIRLALQTFFGVSEEDVTWNYLETRYVDAWCAAASRAPLDFAQVAVSLQQIRTSWLKVTQPKDPTKVPFSLQASFAHMESGLLHRLFRDARVAVSKKKMLETLYLHERIVKSILDKPADEDEDEEIGLPPFGRVPIALQPYAYYVIKAPVKAWEKSRGWSELRACLPAPHYARRYALMEAPASLEEAEDVSLQLRKAPPLTAAAAAVVEKVDEAEEEEEEEPLATSRSQLRKLLAGWQSAGKATKSTPLVMAKRIKPRPDELLASTPIKKMKRSDRSVDEDAKLQDSDQEFEFDQSPADQQKLKKARHDVELTPERKRSPSSPDVEVTFVKSQQTASSPYNPSVYAGSNKELLDTDWRTPVLLLGSLNQYASGYRKIKTIDLIAEKTPRDQASGYFSTYDRSVKMVDYSAAIIGAVHLLAHRLPEEAGKMLEPRGFPGKSIGSPLLMHAGNIGSDYHKNVMLCKPKDLSQTAGHFLRMQVDRICEHPLPGAPSFNPHFFTLTEVLKPLHSGTWGTGKHMRSAEDLASALTPFHFVASLELGTDDPLEAFRIPSAGLKGTAIAKIAINMFTLFHIMAEDERLYPNLPASTSTFSLFSPLGGALIQAQTHIQSSTIATAWEELHEKVGTLHQTVHFLFALGDLIELFTKWQQTKPANTHFQVGRIAGTKTNVSLIGTEVDLTDTKCLRKELAAWFKKFQKDFSAKKLKEQTVTPLVLYERDPPIMFKPRSKSADSGKQVYIKQESAARAGYSNPAHQNSANGPATGAAGSARTQSAKRSSTQTGTGGGNSASPPSSKFLHGNPALIRFSPLHRPPNETQTVAQILSNLRKAHSIDFPSVKGKPACFPFVMEAGCNECYRNKGRVDPKPCSHFRHHVSIKDGDTEYVKADLQQLYNFVKSEHVKKHLLPTEAFIKFMN